MPRTILSPGFDYGHYHVHSLLGKGAMAEVYLASDRRNGNRVALKVLPRGFGDAEARIRRFEREARAIADTSHENVVAIYEVGTENRTPFIAMEYVSGRTLRALLDEGPLSPTVALALARQIAAGLDAAHRAGIVHRDLKPENIMVASDGSVKILDFGLSKPLSRPSTSADADDTDHALTVPGMILGTLEYMSPEQASGKPLDFRADQFAFGAIVYEMLTGDGAFRAASAVQVLAAVVDAEPAPLADHVPASLRTIVTRLLRKEPEDRFDSMTEVSLALESAETGVEHGARTTMLALCGAVLAILAAAFLI